MFNGISSYINASIFLKLINYCKCVAHLSLPKEILLISELCCFLMTFADDDHRESIGLKIVLALWKFTNLTTIVGDNT